MEKSSRTIPVRRNCLLFDSTAAKEAANLFEELRDTGRMINENDLLNAGIALASKEVLLTRDEKLAAIGKNIKTFSIPLCRG